MQRTLTTCLFVLGMICTATAVEIPNWAQARIDATQKRLEAWVGDDLAVIFPYMTDIHSPRVDIASPIDWSDSKMHIYIGQQAARQCKADFFADLGDMAIEGLPTDKALVMLASKRAIYKDFELPVLFAIGNHDHGTNRFFSSAEFGDMFNGATQTKGVKLIFGADKSWGYYDIPSKKTRVFFMNTSDEGYYGLSASQLQFMADNLKMDENWTAVILEHFCVNTNVGHWKRNENHHTTAKNQEVQKRIVEDFVVGKSGEDEGLGVKWDFTANKGTKFAGFFFGDSHFDNHGCVKDVNYTISQGYGWLTLTDLPDATARFTAFKRNEECLVDVVVVKPEKREVRIFRVGQGDADRDRGYSF